MISYSVMCVTCQEDPLDKLRITLPGEPGVDYPILSSIQNTQFDCEGKTFGGFYAEPDTDCQGYHVCLQVRGWVDITECQGYHVCLQVSGWLDITNCQGFHVCLQMYRLTEISCMSSCEDVA